MRWTQTDNPLVWESPPLHFAMAEASPCAAGGFLARIYKISAQMPLWDRDQPPRQLVGTSKWGMDAEAALRQCIMRYDSEAELPDREEVLP